MVSEPKEMVLCGVSVEEADRRLPGNMLAQMQTQSREKYRWRVVFRI